MYTYLFKMLPRILVLFIYFHICRGCDDEDVATVGTSFGRVRGRCALTQFERIPYYSFKGIPYARPPIGSFRFLPPVQPRPWSHRLDCYNFGNVCLQTDGERHIIGNEDCLYLNVFTPNINPTELLSVMVYIHGGAWYNGNGAVVGPDFLLEENVIVVSINYRLGALGFMSLGTADYSGNQGLKDQQAALQWVSANICRFGGNPLKVTLFGDSAGSMSSLFHMWAPASRGLYRRAIEISFTFDVWSIVAKPHHRADMFQFAQAQNASITTTEDLVGFLQHADGNEFVRQFPFKFYANIIMPTIEASTAKWPMTTATPSQLMLDVDDVRTDVDIMAGWTTGEALFLSQQMSMDHFARRMRLQLPSIHFNGNYDSDEYRQVAREICQFYHPNAGEDEMINVERLKSDVYIRYFVDRRVKMLAAKSTGRTYYYRFGAETSLNFFKLMIGAKSGASHGDDLCYIGPCNFADGESLKVYRTLRRDSKEYELIRVMAGMYADFAKYGHPFVGQGRRSDAVRFEAVRSGRYTFVDITNDGLRVNGVDPFRNESAFWDRLMAEHPALLDLHL